MEKITIDEEFIKTIAEDNCNKKLSEDDLEELEETIRDGLFFYVQDKIEELVEFQKLLSRNADADNTFPHFRVSRRNPNAFQPDFKLSGKFKNIEDAKEFISHETFAPEDEWKIELVKATIL